MFRSVIMKEKKAGLNVGKIRYLHADRKTIGNGGILDNLNEI